VPLRERAKLLEDYDALINEVRNQIAEHNYSRSIKIIKKQEDVRFQNDAAAEAKTKYGLPGATLLVWGYAKTERGRLKLETRFSYEFKDTKNKNGNTEEKIKTIITRSFSQAKGGFRVTGEESLDLTWKPLFILGLSCISIGTREFIEKAINFFENIKIKYGNLPFGKEKYSMVPAIKEINKILVDLYCTEMSWANPGSDDLRVLANKTLAIDSTNYWAFIALSFYYGDKKEMILAKEFNDKAKGVRPKKEWHTVFNEAYFKLLEKNFSDALELYKSIPENLGGNIDTLAIEQYLKKNFNETGETPFLFAEGLVAYKWRDENEGKNILKEFLSSEEVISKESALLPLVLWSQNSIEHHPSN